MLDRLRKRHRGDTISIVASGPSANLFKGAAVTIGVNGAALMGHEFDYFLCGDKNAYIKDWFTVECARVRVIAKLVASMDEVLYPRDKFPGLRRLAVPQHEQYKLGHIPAPISPHLTFLYKWYSEGRLDENMMYLMFSGTISCCAVQLAYIMGAKEIELYGCNFHHARRSHYFYKTDQKQTGRVRPSQRVIMDKLLREVRGMGVKVSIFGPTRLTQFDRQYK